MEQIFLTKLRNAWRSRTILFGLGIAILGYLESARPDVDAFISAAHMDAARPFVWPIVGVIIVYLRWTTTLSLSEKK